MTELIRVKARWSGFTGAPGYTVLHFRDFGADGGGGGPVTADAALGAATRVRNFFNGFPNLLPSSVRVQVEAEVDVLEDTTGELVRSIGVTAPAVVAGTATGNFSGPVGVVINWRTNGVRNGRRVRGRSFIVPTAGILFDTTGTPGAANLKLFSDAATALTDPLGTPDLCVYARPSAPGATDGAAFLVTSATVPQMGAVLRSRRD